MPGTDTLKLFHDAFGYNRKKFVMILVMILLDKGHYISGSQIPSRRATLNARKILMIFRLFRAMLGP